MGAGWQRWWRPRDGRPDDGRLNADPVVVKWIQYRDGVRTCWGFEYVCDLPQGGFLQKPPRGAQ